MLVNLSLSGAYVAAEIALAAGEIVDIRFLFPGSTREVEIQGRVVWINREQTHPVHSLPPGFGLSFENLREDSRAILTRALAFREAGARGLIGTGAEAFSPGPRRFGERRGRGA
jgi:hypothetical protein